MTRYLLLTILLISTLLPSMGQEQGGKSRQQMQKEFIEFKMKYLAKEMELDEAQKQQFFTLYEEMSAKKAECMKAAMQLERKIKQTENPTEADYQAVTEAFRKARTEDAAIDEEYSDKFAKILTSKQVFKMKSAEDSFRRKMEEMRHKNKKGKKD